MLWSTSDHDGSRRIVAAGPPLPVLFAYVEETDKSGSRVELPAAEPGDTRYLAPTFESWRRHWAD